MADQALDPQLQAEITSQVNLQEQAAHDKLLQDTAQAQSTVDTYQANAQAQIDAASKSLTGFLIGATPPAYQTGNANVLDHDFFASSEHFSDSSLTPPPPPNPLPYLALGALLWFTLKKGKFFHAIF